MFGNAPLDIRHTNIDCGALCCVPWFNNEVRWAGRGGVDTELSEVRGGRPSLAEVSDGVIINGRVSFGGRA